MPRWFGPILQACGCCYREPPPPPPPPCWCDDDDCTGFYSGNFDRLRFQAILDDAFFLEAKSRRLVCTTTCRNMVETLTYRREWSGFSQFNGTYEIPFYALNNDSEYEEADPTQVTCGVWYFPRIDADVEFKQTWSRSVSPVDFYGTYNDTGCDTVLQETVRTLRIAMETRSGEMYILDPVAPGPVAPFTFGFTGFDFPPLDPNVVLRRKTQTSYACGGGDPDIVFDRFVDTRQPGLMSWVHGIDPTGDPEPQQTPVPRIAGRPVLQGMRLLMIDAALVNSSDQLQPDTFQPIGIPWHTTEIEYPRRSGFYDPSLFPYGGPGIPHTSTVCGARRESTKTEIFGQAFDLDQAYFDEYTPTLNALVQCNPFFPQFSSIPVIPGPYEVPPWSFANSSFVSEFRLLLN